MSTRDALDACPDFAPAWEHRFPSTAMVSAAAGLLPRLAPWDGSEGPRWRVTVAPGVIAVGSHDPARAERTHERRQAAARHRVDQATADLLLEDRLSELDGLLATAIGLLSPASTTVDHARVLGIGRRADGLLDRIRELATAGDRQTARRVTCWSRRSRARMRRRLAELDYNPLFAGGRLPAMVTLTYPGDWLAVAPSAAVCKRHVDELKRRYRAAWGEPLAAVWKREFQRRGAPHYHLFMTPPAGVDARGRRFGVWLAQTWAAIVGASTSCCCEDAPAGCDDQAAGQICRHSERGRHLYKGTDLSYAEGMRSADPVRLAVYFAKHGTYGSKEYQNHAPAEWGDGSVGRFWGFWGLQPARVVVDVPEAAARLVGRSLRRWQRANGYRVQGDVWRKRYRTSIDTTTGEISTTWRWTKRRSGRRIGARMQGVRGFAVANDAPALLSQIARLVDPPPRPSRPLACI